MPLFESVNFLNKKLADHKHTHAQSNVMEAGTLPKNDITFPPVTTVLSLPQGAGGWLNATGCNLDMYLDSERHLYNTVGLHRSVSKVWNMVTMHYYASMVAQGRKLPAAIQGVEDDPLQMGGDFTFRCADHILVMTHPSKNPKDRPDINKILQVVKTTQ